MPHLGLLSPLLYSVVLSSVMLTFTSAQVGGVPPGIELTLVAGANGRGAVCLDGSLPGYHLDAGSGMGSNSWIIHLQGGAWCADAYSCAQRAQTSLGSSHFMSASPFQGILSSSPRVNPYFYNWNRVKVRYCDGGSFSGNAEVPVLGRVPGTNQLQLLYFCGQRIWDSVMEDLLAKGMAHATQGNLQVASRL